MFNNMSSHNVYLTFRDWDNIYDLNKGKMKNAEIISYGYDNKEKNLFCILENGRLVKLNI